MKDFFLNFFAVYNKIFSSQILIYFLFINFLLIFYLFFIALNGFFQTLIAFIFLINSGLFIGQLGVDFFTALMLGAEFPILLVLLIFYFQKNSLQIDNIYKYRTVRLNLKYFYAVLILILTIIYINSDPNIFYFYNFIFNTTYSIFSRNDFLTIYIIYYKINNFYIYIFAILIFFVSLLLIFFFQINKIYRLKNIKSFKNVLILRKQNILKQGIFNSKLKFFNKKINKKN